MAGLTFPFGKTDGGRSVSSRPKQKNDCTVIALAVVTGLRHEPGLGWGVPGDQYDRVYDLLARDGRRSHRGFNIDRWIYGQVDPAIGDPEYILGWTAERIAFPAVKGQRRMNPYTFTRTFESGRFICRTAGHVFAVVDGVIYDQWAPRQDRCIYAAWRFTPATGQVPVIHDGTLADPSGSIWDTFIVGGHAVKGGQ